MEIEKLYTTNEISEIYKVKSWIITQKWFKQGLKYIPGRPARIKIKWVEEFIENRARESAEKSLLENEKINVAIKPLKRRPLSLNKGKMILKMEDIL